MKPLFLLYLCFPFVLSAQLDRLNPNLTEQEFLKAFPEAMRDFDEEAYWTGGADTINGIEGSALWLLYNDTVDTYRFLSMKVEGPSKDYPKFDSTAVHNMKVCLDKVRSSLEAEFGKPDTYRNISLQNVGNPGVNRAYSVVWTFPGSNNYIQLSVSTDLSSGNYINAPGKYTVAESQSYEMRIEITHRSDYTMLWYDIGKSSERFFTIYKNFRAPLLRDRIYTMSDSTVSSNAVWTVKFSSSQLVSFSYTATTGTAHRAKTDAEAYIKLRDKAAQLLKEGEKAYGKTDSVSNLMTPKYAARDHRMLYHATHLYAAWKSPQGKTKIIFEEHGGGKSPDVTFNLQVVFVRLD
jgi:hypothetical protein